MKLKVTTRRSVVYLMNDFIRNPPNYLSGFVNHESVNVAQ